MEGDNVQQPKPIPSKLNKRDIWIIITTIIVCVILLSTIFIVVLGSKYELKIHIVSTTYTGLISIEIEESQEFWRFIKVGEERVETIVLYRGEYDILVHSDVTQETTVLLNSDKSITFFI